MAVVVLPGMGATSEMYRGPWRSLPDSIFCDWPPYDGELTLADTARRVVSSYPIGPADVLIGTSLGGMVALEIASMVGVEKVILVSSAVSPMEVRSLLRLLAPLAEIAPIRFAQVIAGSVHSEKAKMFRNSDPRFLRAMCLAVADWQGAPIPRERIHRIHGERDLVIRCPEDAAVIPGAGHLLAITHAERCVQLVREFLDRT